MKEFIKLIRIEDLKSTGLYAVLIGPLMGFFAPVSNLVFWLMVSVVLDVLTGIYKNRVVFKRPLTSRAFFERKAKVVVLWVIGLITFLIADQFLMEIGIKGNWGAKVYCVWYGLYEAISIMENLGESGLKGMKYILQLFRGKLPQELDKSLEEAQSDED